MVFSEEKAESAAGVGQADGEDHETDQRDADGREPLDAAWRGRPFRPTLRPLPSPGAKTTDRESGTHLDLTG